MTVQPLLCQTGSKNPEDRVSHDMHNIYVHAQSFSFLLISKEVAWNRTVNLNCGRGNKIATDLSNEGMNRDFKGEDSSSYIRKNDFWLLFFFLLIFIGVH